MQNHLISAGLSILVFCSCGSSTTDNSSGVAGSKSSSGGATATATAGSSSSNVAGAPASGGSSPTAGASAAGGSSGTSSNSAGSTSGGATASSAGSAGTPASSGGSGGAATQGACTRDSLQTIATAYNTAQKAGDKTKLPLAASVTYTENFKTTTMGIWDTALAVTYQHDLLDTGACQTFSEVYVTGGDVEYVIGIRLAVVNGQITEMESIVTTGTVSGSTITSHDWNFDANAYLTCAKSEDWSVVPEASRSSREDLIAAGSAYFMLFSDKTTVVPWGTPCYRLEGGKGCTPAIDMASTSCDVGVPSGITFKNTHWVVDLELNTAVGMTMFGGADPDAHTFRLIDGKIRKVHTITQGTG